MRKHALFLVAVCISLLTVLGLSACGKAIPSPQLPQVSSMTPIETPTPTPAPPSAVVQVVLAEMFTGDW